MSFRGKGGYGSWVDCDTETSGGLHLMLDGPAHAVLANDCDRVLNDGRLLDDEGRLYEPLERCRDSQQRANSP